MTLKYGPAAHHSVSARTEKQASFSRKDIVSTARRAGALLLATLREIFDESSYRRFLERGRIASSPAAYATFQRENDAAKARRPKCC